MQRDDTSELFAEHEEADLVPAEQPSPFFHPSVAPEPPLHQPAPRSTAEGILDALERTEEELAEVRRVLQTSMRERRHREFSPARLIGSIAQALVLGLILWALSDWVFAEPSQPMLIKLAFAAVLQLMALTAFVLGREVD